MTESTDTGAPGAGTLVAGRYRLDELAGVGGMAQVWAATDQVLGRRVAVKLLHPALRSDDALLRRFRQEGRLSARLTDPNIVGIYDTVSSPEAEAIVMELVSGTTLRRQLDERGRLDPESVVDLGCRVSDALEVAHRNGLTHRDIKPANILICEDGSVKVADFGIAKTADLDDLTRAGTLMGTATYLAPEQLRGEPLDGRADLYSLGVVLYEAACGQPPFTGENEIARAMQRLHQDPVPPHQVRSEIPVALSHCIMRILEREPDRRPGSAGELRAELLDCLEPTSPGFDAPLPPARERPVRRAPGRRTEPPRRRTPRRNRLGIIVLILLIGGSVALILGLLQQEHDRSGRGGTDGSEPAAPGPIPIASVTAFDPEGTGPPGENDAQVARATDDDPATSWSTEGYDQRDFGTKSGVGLVLTLPATDELATVEITSPSTAWSADAYVLDSAPTGAPTGKPTASVTNATGNVSLDLGDRRGRVVLVWFTVLGGTSRPYRVEIGEVAVRGTA